ncbi:hypothetical protein EGH24_13835 [Halonotius terrestris]|uniref:Uncharacterized protein n=1 Tax=Halonotius terrestris TaxID=2487750 RepID=A0A8J8P9S3_9EURY|nr:hypothetical protein [Halonotius terrestris]TQQ78598.1 hypothetical protein EGH24_13835 [Halonotius terrestris]
MTVTPLQLAGIGTRQLALIGGGALVIVLIAVVLLIGRARGWFARDPMQQLAQSLDAIRGDSDVVALLPYDDGTFFLKAADFDKELIGGQGGYETEDGDKIVLDGGGEPVREFLGVPLLLALDPTEHASAVDPIKSLVAQKHSLGQWLKVDKQGNVLAAGDGVLQAADDVDVGLEDSMVDEYAQEHEVSMDAALATLEQQGDITKVMDIAPPSGVRADGGELVVEEASHIAIDQSKAADLMPTTTSTVELNTALDKARMEEYEEGRNVKYMVYGIIIGFLGALIGGGVFLGLNAVV